LFEDPVIVYDVLDDLAVYRGGERLLAKRYRSAEQHHRLLDEAHVVTASSHVLADQIREARPAVIVVENGVDARRFTPQATRPADLPIDRPLIGFHGAIERWFNFELLFEVARRRPDWLFVNVGPIGSDVAKEVEYTGTLPNITFLGERSSDAIPGYVAAFDVEVTLAAGTPCVAPPLPACEALPIVHIGSTADEVAAAVVRAFDDRDGFLRSVAAVVAEAAWGERIRPLLDRLDELGSRSVPS
jgi:glycosyltransferase involved in cell wall biosynthesis